MADSIKKIGKVTTESVKKCTGKSWDQWVAILNRAGAKNWQHSEIAALLKTKYKLSKWWQQGVAMGFELHCGTRIEGRSSKGTYGTVATKTFPLSSKKAWDFVRSEKGLAVWLGPFSAFEWKKGAGFEVPGGVFGEVRTVKAGSRLRLSWNEERWPKGSVVQLHINPRKGEKCMIVITHEGIPNEQEKLRLRTRWKDSLANLLLSIS